MKTISLETVQWSSLPEIDEVQPIGDKDKKVLEEIRDVLVRNNCTERFGISLLHKHFEVGEGEVAVEYTDVERRESKVVVEPRGSDNEGRIETNWRFRVDGPRADIECKQECNYNKGHKKIHIKVKV